MQFIPSTWSVVGVDADGDGERNPQDIDDAALATAVYLCSGKDDLGTTEGQRASVYRYNHSQAYVDLVLSIMNAYLAGDFTSVPNGTTSAGMFVPAPAPPAPSHNNHGGGTEGRWQEGRPEEPPACAAARAAARAGALARPGPAAERRGRSEPADPDTVHPAAADPEPAPRSMTC